MQDKEVVETIKDVAHQYDLAMDHRQHGGKFRTVYLVAPFVLPRTEQERRLEQAFRDLLNRGILANMARHDNPSLLNRSIGKMEDGHHRHGDPLIEIHSVWWDEPG